MFFDTFLFLLMALYFNKVYGAAIGILLLCCAALIQIGYILLFKKVGLSPWKALIPFYNMHLFYGKIYEAGNHMIPLCCVALSEIVAVVLLFMKIPNLLIFLSAIFFGFLISVFIYWDISKAFGVKSKLGLPVMVLFPWAILIFYGIAKDIQFGNTTHFADVGDTDVFARVITGLILCSMLFAVFTIAKSCDWFVNGIRPVTVSPSVTTAVSGTDIGKASGTDIEAAPSTDTEKASDTDIGATSSTDINSLSSSDQNINTATATDIK